MRDLSGSNASTLYEEYYLSPDPVDIFSLDYFFLETAIEKGMIFRGNRTGIIFNFTLNVGPVCKNIAKFGGGIQGIRWKIKTLIQIPALY